jgi:hypothetical protein
MAYRILVSILIVIAIAGCNSKKLAQDERIASLPAAAQTCYLHAGDKDTVRLTLTFDNQSVSGELTYNIFEKDGNVGTLRGRTIGDTILASYEFQSEGVKSVRDVAFLKRDETLVEGFAPMDSSGIHFANRAELDFTGIVLKAVNCYE